MAKRFTILFFALGLFAFSRAENPIAGNPGTVAPTPSAAPSAAPTATTPAPEPKKKSLREQLFERLLKRDGTPASVVIFAAMETTATELGQEFSRTIEAAMKSYGRIDVRREDYMLPAMTMEEMRTAMVKYKADVILIPIVRDDAVDLFLFDKRTPYQLYAHSEVIPNVFPKPAPAVTAAETTRLLMRRILFRYLRNQYYELPREESLPVLQSEIPKWIASPDSLQLVNREIKNRFYLNISLGAAINMARSDQLWNSQLLGAQFGVRVAKRWFVEAQFATFAYNAFVGSVRYTFLNRQSPFRVNVGLGFGMLTRDKVWTSDQTIGLGRFSYYIVPSAAVLFPIGQVYLKLEGQLFVPPAFNQFVWTFMPGIQVHF